MISESVFGLDITNLHNARCDKNTIGKINTNMTNIGIIPEIPVWIGKNSTPAPIAVTYRLRDHIKSSFLFIVKIQI